MKITRIVELNKGFLVVFEDGGEIRLSEEIYFTESIYEKEELSREEIDGILHRDKVLEAEILCKRYLAGGLRPRRRLLAYMESKGIDDDVALETIDRLEADKYLDDLKFAEKKARRKMISSPVSRAMLMVWLDQEGVDRETAERVVKKLNIDDNKTAARLLEKRFRREGADRKRMASYLASRGFDGDTICSVLGMEDLWNM
ncbi:MAG: regulatory protein RecX [Clostridia bacterium]|nr:regulatory protein RecX [Clostridia bacterium]